MMTLLAPVRLTPRPPTLVVSKKIKMDLSCEREGKKMVSTEKKEHFLFSVQNSEMTL